MTIIILSAIGYAYLLWVLFLAVMALYVAWGSLPGIPRALALPIVIVAFGIDIIFNVLASVPLLDLPQESTFSQRMGRYKRDGSGWRCTLARWVCANLLDPFQLGGHCR